MPRLEAPSTDYGQENRTELICGYEKGEPRKAIFTRSRQQIGVRDFACGTWRQRNSQSGPTRLPPSNIVATRGLVDTFLPGDLRGFAHTFFRTDKVCPGFGQYVRVPGRFVRQFATKQLNRFAGGLSSDAITDL